MTRNRKQTRRGVQGRPTDPPPTPRANPDSKDRTRPQKDARSETAAQPPPDRVEEASIDSFPCSDPPGYGHA